MKQYRMTFPPGCGQISLFEAIDATLPMTIPEQVIAMESSEADPEPVQQIDVRAAAQASTLALVRHAAVKATARAKVAAPAQITTDFWAGAEIIHEHSWLTMIASGELVEVSDLAREAGFVIPTAITANLSAIMDYKMAVGENRTGRLWDLLSVASWQIKRAPQDVDRVIFRVKFDRVSHECMASVGPKGPSDPSPAITIWLGGEYED